MRWTHPVPLLLLAGCVGGETIPDSAIHSLTVAGDYNAVADCTYSALEKQWSPRKADQPSRSTTALTLSTNDYDYAKLTFTKVGANSTRVDAHLGAFAFANSIWNKDWRPAVQKCSG